MLEWETYSQRHTFCTAIGRMGVLMRNMEFAMLFEFAPDYCTTISSVGTADKFRKQKKAQPLYMDTLCRYEQACGVYIS